MDISEYSSKSNDVLANLENQGKVSLLLSDMTNGFSDALKEIETLKAENERLTSQNDELRDNNQKLFLRVSIPDDAQANANKKKDTYEYDDLFTNGRLKLEG